MVSAVSLIIAGILTARQTEQFFLGQVEENLLSEAELVASQFQDFSLQPDNWQAIDSLTDLLGKKITARITIIDTAGRVLGDSYKSGAELLAVENHLLRPEVQQAISSTYGRNVRFSSTVRMRMFYVALPIWQEQTRVGFARLALPLTQLAQQEKQITEVVVIGILIAMVFSLILSVVLAGRLTKPIKSMAESARQIVQGDFQVKIRPQTRDEVSELAQYFNQMVSQLGMTVSELKSEKLQLDSIVSNMKEGVIAFNSGGKILLANESAKKMFGLENNIGRQMYYENLRHPQLNELLRQALDFQNNASAEISLGYPEEKILLTEVLALKGAQENQVAVILVSFDITRLKKLEKIRKDFVANASHELRTPLTSIKGYVEALQDGAINDSEQARDFLRTIARQADRMSNIISDLLLLSELEAEDFKLKTSRFSLQELIKEVVQQFIRKAEQKVLILQTDFEKDIDKVTAEREKILQVLANLVDNAIKFTPDGGKITLGTSRNEAEVIVFVKDTGIGIPSTDIPRIFERFYTVDKARSRELGGTGLGLSIVKHIVEAHGGKVWVESELNKGSTFYFSLPA